MTIMFGAFLLSFAPLEKLGVDLSLTFANQFLMIALLTPLAFAVAGVQSLVALLAKTFKEAQTYIQLLSLAPVGLLLMTSLSGDEAGNVMQKLPLTGHAHMIGEFMTGAKLDWGQAMNVTATSLAMAFISLFISQRHIQNEKVLGQS